MVLVNLEEGSSTGDFERWMKGALGMERLSLKRLRGVGLGVWGAPSLGTLEGMLSKARKWASLSAGAPLQPRGTWNLEGAHIPGTVNDE
jgi:hypothetical protein